MRLVSIWLSLFPAVLAAGETKNIIFVMADGLRVQELFGGADSSVLTVKNVGSLTDVEALEDRYLRDTAEARREALLPFFWQVVAKQGQIYGNRALGSEAVLTNKRNFSYPGYSEILCGFADDRIDSNAKVPNPNVTVLEWLHRKPEFAGRVAAFGAWDVFPYILNAERAGFLVSAGNDPLTLLADNPRIDLLNSLKTELPEIWSGEAFDALTFHTALEYFKQRKPRVLFISLGETDEWGHAGNYRHYLKSANLFDRYLRTLWETAQSMPEYRGSTTLIVGVDHGRGNGPEDWKNHGEKVVESKWHWMAFLGPDTRPLGERRNVPPVTQSQVAATLAALLDEDYASAQPKAGKPIQDVLPD
jgi:hypothetical protein